MYKVKFQFEQKGKESIVIEDAPIDDSILEIALKNGIEIHHNCGGVSACSTCHVYVEQGGDFIEELNDRARNPKLTSRLSCQCVLLPGDGEILVTVPDQTVILGE
jgi:ferredoxin, 2Fe-2S